MPRKDGAQQLYTGQGTGVARQLDVFCSPSERMPSELGHHELICRGALVNSRAVDTGAVDRPGAARRACAIRRPARLTRRPVGSQHEPVADLAAVREPGDPHGQSVATGPRGDRAEATAGTLRPPRRAPGRLRWHPRRTRALPAAATAHPTTAPEAPRPNPRPRA